MTGNDINTENDTLVQEITNMYYQSLYEVPDRLSLREKNVERLSESVFFKRVWVQYKIVFLKVWIAFRSQNRPTNLTVHQKSQQMCDIVNTIEWGKVGREKEG